MDKQAKTLAEALPNFSPRPLEFTGHRSSFYVERDDEPLANVRNRLLAQTGPSKFLVAGHRGSGKSTEINRLVVREEIRARFEVVKFSAQEELDLVDLDYVDLLFFSAARVFTALVADAEKPIELTDEVLKRLDLWRQQYDGKLAREVTTEAERSVAGEVATGVKLSVLRAFFAEIQARLRVERTTRQVTRQIVEPRLSEFLTTLEIFYREVDDALSERQRQLLLVVEDLDKIPDIAKAQVLFRDKGAYLTQPPCSILYTLPIALHYDPAFQGVARTFGYSVFLPNVPLRQKDGTGYAHGSRLMREFVTRRIEESLIEPSALEMAIEKSGGVFMQIQRLMDLACLRAFGSGRTVIEISDVDEAALDLRFEYERQLAERHYHALDRVDRTREASSEDDVLVLLHSLHLIEYRNRERWCMVNPLLQPALARWRALQEKESAPSRA